MFLRLVQFKWLLLAFLLVTGCFQSCRDLMVFRFSWIVQIGYKMSCHSSSIKLAPFQIWALIIWVKPCGRTFTESLCVTTVLGLWFLQQTKSMSWMEMLYLYTGWTTKRLTHWNVYHIPHTLLQSYQQYNMKRLILINKNVW